MNSSGCRPGAKIGFLGLFEFFSRPELGEKLELFTAESLRDYLKTKNQVIDFIKFSNDHIEGLIKDDRSGSAKTLQTVVFSLSDYFKRKSVSPIEINEQMLTRYERFLRNSREITRLNQFKKPISRRVKGMNDAGVHNHLRDCRSVIAIPLQIGEGIALLPAFLIGQMAAKKLVSLIVSNRAPTGFETLVLPTQLFARESSLNLSKVK